MGILAWIVLGLIAGALAKLVLPGKDPGGCIVTCALGVVGALLGGFIGSFIGFGPVTGLDLRSIGLAAAGAILVLLIYRAATKA